MQRSLIILALFGIGLTTPASAQDPAADAKAACESFDALAATVSKRVDRPYRAGRSKDWAKVKNRNHPAIDRVMDSF